MNDTTKGPDAPAAGRTKTPRKASGARRATRATKAAAAEHTPETTVPAARDAREMPGYVWKDVKHPTLDITERVQVFDPKLAEQQGLTGENREADLMNQQAQTSADALSKAASPQE